MGDLRARWKRLHWIIRSLALFCLLLGLYAAAGFWGVPALGGYLLENQVAERLEKEVALDQLTFNPFTWRFELSGLEVSDADFSDPVLAMGGLQGNLQFGDLLDLALRLEDLQCRGLQVQTAGFDVPGAPFTLDLNGMRAATRVGLERSSEPDSSWMPVVNATLGINECTLSEPEHGTVVSLASGAVELERFAPLEKTATVNAISLQAPFAKVVRRGDGNLNWAGYFVASASANATAPDPPSSPFAFSLASFTVANGIARFEDRSVASTVEKRVALNATLSDLSTTAPSPASFQARARTKAGETVEVKGDLRLAPALATNGSLAFDGVSLPHYGPYYQPALPFELASGQVQGRTTFRFAPESDEQLHLAGSDLAISGLSLCDPQLGTELFSLPQANVTNGTVRLDGQAVHIAAVDLQGGKVHLQRHADGQLHLMRLLGEVGSQKASTATSAHAGAGRDKADASPAWRVRVQESTLADWTVRWQDEAAPRPDALTVSDIDLALRHIDSALATPLELALSGSLNTGGNLTLDGNLDPKTLTGTGSFALNDLDIRAGRMYVPGSMQLSLRRGVVDGTGTWKLRPGDGIAPQLSGDLALKEFEAGASGDPDTLLGVTRLACNGFSVALPEQAITIRKVQLVEPYADLKVNANGRLNLRTVFSGEPAHETNATRSTTPRASDTSAPQENARERKLAVNQIEVEKGYVAFADQTFSPAMSTSLQDISASLDELVLGSPEPSRLTLKAGIEGHAPLYLQGQIAPFARPVQSDLTLTLSNLDMVTLSPYLRKYLAYPVSTGQLSWESSIATKENTLQASNAFRFERFVLGEKVDDPDAPNIPVKLALSLLQDGQGDMDLNVPVEGDLNDPGFRLGGVIMKAIIGVFRNIVSAPFSFIGSMFGSGEDVSFVSFAPGRADLTDMARTKLQTVAEALKKRPRLQIDLTGLVDSAADRQAMRDRAFDNRIKGAKYRELEQAGVAPQDIGAVSFGDQEEYRKYVVQVYQKILSEAGDKAPADEDLSLETMEERIRATIAVTANELQALAAQRTAVVQSFLIAEQEVAAEQVFRKSADTAISEQDKARVRLGLHG